MNKVKTKLHMQEICKRIDKVELPDFDIIIGIATGGIVPASLLAYKTGIPMGIIQINYRDVNNNPVTEEPKVLSNNLPSLKNKKILMVDDVSVSGKTFEKARSLFEENEITTFVMKGKGDFVMFPEIKSCVIWPWKTE